MRTRLPLWTALTLLLAGCISEGRVGDDPNDGLVDDAKDAALSPPETHEADTDLAEADASGEDADDDATNAGPPCLAALPDMLQFCGVALGDSKAMQVSIEACGGPVTIAKVAFAGPNPEAFALGDDPVGLTLPAGDVATLDVTFTPPAEGVFTAILTIWMAEDLAPLHVPLAAQGGPAEAGTCGSPELYVSEGERVVPQTKLHLDGSQVSASSPDPIAKYEWTVEQPPGAASVIAPSRHHPSPSLEVNVAGVYILHLRVWDQLDNEHYVGWRAVFVIPDQALHVELLWHTPDDLDEADEGPEAGADLDLHFMHPFAEGDWFGDFTTYWFNPAPEWGAMGDKGDDPSLDRDDTDGAGPENLNLAQPEDGLTYLIGVHYWNDHGFGASHATVRVYVHGALAYQASEEMTMLDLCEFATVSWPSGVVSPVGPAPNGTSCTPNVLPPRFRGR